MLDAITTSQIAMNQDRLQLQSISHNLANMHTPGYKRTLLVNAPFDALLSPSIHQVSEHMHSVYQIRQASFEQTNAPYDFAINGTGFFTIETEQGQAYTRRGDFHLNNRGELVTHDGHRVLGLNGPIRLNGEAIKLLADGSIQQENKRYAKLQLVKFNSSAGLRAIGNGYYITHMTPQAVDSQTRVLQGMLEQSNVTSVDEMVAMTQIARHFESTQRAIKTADNMLSQAISQLGEG